MPTYARIFWPMVFLVPLGSGCTHEQLCKNTLGQMETVHDLQQQQVLDNLAMFACNPYSYPYFSVVTSGTTSLTDTGSLSITNGFGRSGLSFVYNSLGINPSVTRASAEQWSVNPINDSVKLTLMRCVYQRAVAACCIGTGESPDCPNCQELFNGLYRLPPVVTRIDPQFGSTDGKQEMHIYGKNLLGVTEVKFGDVPVRITAWLSDTEIIVQTPPSTKDDRGVLKVGPVPVTVGSANVWFTYVPPPIVTNIKPPHGPAGTNVTIEGMNLAGATAVTFDNMPATKFTYNSDTEIDLQSPPLGKLGPVDVTVATPFGTSRAATFTYLASTPDEVPAPPVARTAGSAQPAPKAAPPPSQAVLHVSGLVTPQCLAFSANWFCWGPKNHVPKGHCCKLVGHYCDMYVWVPPEHIDELTKLTLLIQDIAFYDFPDAGRTPTQFPITGIQQAAVLRAVSPPPPPTPQP